MPWTVKDQTRLVLMEENVLKAILVFHVNVCRSTEADCAKKVCSTTISYKKYYSRYESNQIQEASFCNIFIQKLTSNF